MKNYVNKDEINMFKFNLITLKVKKGSQHTHNVSLCVIPNCNLLIYCTNVFVCLSFLIIIF